MSVFDDDLAEVAASLLEPEGIGEFGEREGSIYHRVSVDGIDAADQLHLMPATADDQPLEALRRTMRFEGEGFGQPAIRVPMEAP